jgi:spermidine/putrescine-binding protein
MRLTIEMHDPEGTILREIADRAITRSSVAITYAFLIAQQGGNADWARINQAIMARWKGKGVLMKIKKAAWRQVDEWQHRGSLRKVAELVGYVEKAEGAR